MPDNRLWIGVVTSIGEKLSRERESRGATIEDMVRRTGIGRSYLQALENNDFAALPGRAFGKLYIRAYGEALGFDPASLIADYETQSPRSEATAAPDLEAEPVPSAMQDSLRRSSDEFRETRAGAARARSEPIDDVARESEDSPAETVTEPQEEVCEQQLTASEEDTSSEVAVIVDAEGGATSSRRLSRGWIGAVAASLLIGSLVVVWALMPRFRGSPPPPVEPAREDRVARLPARAPAHERPEIAPSEPVAGLLENAQSPARARTSGDDAVGIPDRLSVAEFGVGQAVVHRQLVGRSDEFDLGDRAAFFTRVVGGASGERIRHVWLHESRQVQVIELELGGPHWRTYSEKRLRAVGQWTVEARDTSDRVLARASFTCSPTSR